MKKNGKKSGSRNDRFKPWRPLVPFQVPPDAATHNVVAAFQNHLATVFIKETDSCVFQNPDGSPMRIAHLMIQFNKDLRGTDEYFYKLKMRIKDELCGEQSDFLELGPARWREENFRQTHLWVSPNGATFPIGIIPVDIEKALSKSVGGRQNLIMKEELEVFVVRHDSNGIIEVFASEDEAKEMYTKSGAEIPESSGVEMIGDVPAESPTAAWTDAAKSKVANVLAKSRAAQDVPIMESPELFYENDNPDFDDTDECEIDLEYDDDGPVSDEERIAIASAMEEAMAARSDRRVEQMRAVTAEVVGQADKDISDAMGSAKPRIIIA